MKRGRFTLVEDDSGDQEAGTYWLDEAGVSACLRLVAKDLRDLRALLAWAEKREARAATKTGGK